MAQSAGAASGIHPPAPASTENCATTTSPSATLTPASTPRPSVAAQATGTAMEAVITERATWRSRVITSASESGPRPANEADDHEHDREQHADRDRPGGVDQKLRARDRRPPHRQGEEAGDRSVAELATEHPGDHDAETAHAPGAGDLGGGEQEPVPIGGRAGPELRHELRIPGCRGKQDRAGQGGDPDDQRDRRDPADQRPAAA